MNSHNPKIFRLTEGIDAYNPEITQEELVFAYLTNVEPRLGRLFATKGFALFQDIISGSDEIWGFAYYQLQNRQYTDFYCFSRTKVFWFDFVTNAFVTTPIYTGFFSSQTPYAFIPWYDALYVTKPYSKYVKLQHKVATEIAGAPFARYAIIANSHAYLGAVSDGASYLLSRLRWSDLEAPESFDLDPDNSEADFFDLEPSSKQLTGLSYQRGSPIAYAENDIWIGSYVGANGGFHHEPLFPGLGNLFHDSVVRGKEIDYFIGPDNFYALNGLQVVPIGDKMFERFIADVNYSAGTDVSVRGYLDTRANQVFWVYTSVAKAGLWSIVYNYKEDKWSERDPQDLRSWFDAPRIAFAGYLTIDDTTGIINSDSDIIDQAGGSVSRVIPQLAGATYSNGHKVIGKATSANTKFDGTFFDHVVETVDFYFDDFVSVKEITKAALEYTKSGTPLVYVQVGTRHSQSESLTWSSAVVMTNLEGSLEFFIKSEGMGKYLRFRFLWSDSGTLGVNNLVDLRLLSLTKVEQQDAATDK